MKAPITIVLVGEAADEYLSAALRRGGVEAVER
jgi:hypothetical protein